MRQGQPIQIEIEFMGNTSMDAFVSRSLPNTGWRSLPEPTIYPAGEGVQQTVDVYRRRVDVRTGLWREEFLYHNRCLVGYPLPPQVPILEGP